MNEIVDPMKYSHFSYKYAQPIKNFFGIPQVHPGHDFNNGSPKADEGMKVKAVYGGEVVFSAWAGGWGNLIVIRHDLPFTLEVNGKTIDKFWTRSAHLQRRKVGLGKVKTGQIIGLCGHTGGNWDPHLHFDCPIIHLPTHFRKWTGYTSWWSIAKTKRAYGNFFDIKKQFNSKLAKEPSKEDVKKAAEDNEVWNKFARTGLIKKNVKREDVMTMLDYARIYHRLNYNK